MDEVVAAIEADGTRRFLHRDTLGSVVAVTDAGGAVVERHAYGPFGESAVLTGTPWRFAGQRLDPESGLYYMRGRHYSPMLGRFVQPDPIGYEGGLNLYAYVNNDPLNLSDPMGTEPVNKAGIMAALLDGQQHARENPINANTGATQEAGDARRDPMTARPMVVPGVGGGGGGGGGGGSRSVTSGNPIPVTKDGVALPADPKYTIPENYIQNPYRSGSYGETANGKFMEKLRIDPATPPGAKGPNNSHYHLDGKGTHYSPRPGDKDPGFSR